MVNNIVPENIQPAPEQKITVKSSYSPETARRKLGKYFINEPVVQKIKNDNTAKDFLEGKDLEIPDQKKGPAEKIVRKKDIWGKKILEKTPRFDDEGKREIEFVDMVKRYHEKVTDELQKTDKLFEDNADQFLDSLSVGILYKIYKDKGIPSLKHTLNFPQLLESEQYKIAYRTALLSLAEASLDKMNGPDLKEIDMFQRYLEKRGAPQKDLSDIELRNYFVKLVESHPREFLKDYYVNFRFTEDENALRNARNTFKLGEITAGEVIEADRILRSKSGEIKNFLPYEDRERTFDESKQFWRTKTIIETRKTIIREYFSEALHGKKSANNRSEQALIDLGVLKADKKGGLTAESEFIDIFSDYFENDKNKPEHNQNQMVLGMLYNLKAELGCGTLPKDEVLRRAKEIIPGLQRAGNDVLGAYINDNFQEFYPELGYYAQKGMLGESMKKEFDRIFGSTEKIDFSTEPTQRQDESDQDFADRRINFIDFRLSFNSLYQRNKGEIATLLVNNKYIDGFKLGEGIAYIIKKTAEKKRFADNKNLVRLDSQMTDENAVMKLLIEGRDIKDQQIYDRLERTASRTLRFKNFVELAKNTTPAKALARLKIKLQNKLFYSEGESPWLARPSVGTEATAIVGGGLGMAAYGHAVNYFMEDPVNRAVQAGLFMVEYFGIKEGGAYIKEINARKKELGLVKPKKPKKYEGSRKKYELEKKAYKEQMKLIKREVGEKFWHNKVKMLYSSGSYLITSLGINYILQRMGLSGSEAPMVLAATNVAVSGLLSTGGLRSGAESVVNTQLGSKKAVDGGMELLTGNKRELPAKATKPEFHFKYKIIDKPFQALKNKAGKAYATNIAPNIEKVIVKVVETAKKSKYINEVMTHHAEENHHLLVLEKFVKNKNNSNEKLSKEELIEAVEFLTLMKEEEGMLMIHNSRYYAKRMIRQPDGSFIEINNRKGLENIDQTRKEIMEYAQSNLPKEDYDDVVESTLDFYSDIKTIRQKVFYKRMKYLVASYGYRATFMIFSHMLQYEGGLLEEPMNKILGNATMDPQHIIEQAPTTIFHANTNTPQGQEAIAKEVWARAEELNNLVNLMGTSEQLSEFQPGIESHLAYYGVNQQQIEFLVDNLAKSNLNTSDLMRVIYVLSSYKEGQEYLATVSGFEGTERRNLAPMITNMAVDPVGFINRAMSDEKNAALLLLKYPDIAEKLGIEPETIADQINPLVIPESVKEQLLTNNVENNPVVITTTGPQIISISNVVAEFVDGLSKADRRFKIDFFLQMNGVYNADTDALQKAMDLHYGSFLADTNQNFDLSKNPLLTSKLIEKMPADSMIYEIYHAIDPQTDAEIFQVSDLLNKAKSGDVNAYIHLSQLVVAADTESVNNIFDSKVDSSLYDKILDNLPGDESLRKKEIIRRLQQEMIGMGLRPVLAPIMGLEEMTDINNNPDIFTDPREALMHALSPGNSDLEMAVAMTGRRMTLFVQNEQIVGSYKKNLQCNIKYSPEDLTILKAIEGSESDNNRWTLPKIFGKNLAYAVRLRETASGTTPPAGSLIEMMTGDIGRDNAMNPDAPAALHNFDAYGPGYLAKLIIAHFRGRVPEDLLRQMGPDADLTQSIHDKNPSLIERLCHKFETLIAEKILVAKYGEDKVGEVFLNHVTVGTADGIQLKGVEAASQVLFAKSFEELTLGEKFLIEALGQSPGEYLYDNLYDAQGDLVSSTPNPAKAVTHAIHIIENGKIGDNLDKYFKDIEVTTQNGMSAREQILSDLHAMDGEVKNKGWKSVFNMHLPADIQNFAATPDAARYMGMTDEQIAEAIKNGEIKKVTFTVDGTQIIELNDITIEETSRVIPEGLMAPYELTSEQRVEGQLAAQYSAAVTGAIRNGNYYTTVNGTQIPAWWTVFKDEETGQMVENVIPGMAMVMIGGEENAVSMIDPTGSMSQGPQLVGSIFKPLVVYYAVSHDPTYTNMTFDTAPTTIDGLPIENSMAATDYAGSINLQQTLSASANVPMAHLWATMRGRDPNFWEHFQKFSRDQWGIVYYEVNDQGEFVPRTTEPLSDAAFGNLYIGGVDPKQSGLITVAEAYQSIGEAGYLGEVKGNYDKDTVNRMIEAGKYVIESLTNEDLKREIPIWTEEQIKMFKEGAGKTGTQSGVDKYGNWIAIRAGTYFMKYYPEMPATDTAPAIPARVDVVGVMMAGKDPLNDNIELDWGSRMVLPIASNVIQSSGIVISPELAENAVDALFTSPEVNQNYCLGAVNIDRLYPFIKSLSSEDQYAYLREAIRSEDLKYLFVDLVGTPIDGEVQPIAIHFIDKDGANKIFTLSLPADLIEPAGPLINQFSDTNSQTAIVELLTKAVQSEPEKYGGLLLQLQNQGINFVSLHDYEASPALFAIHENMEKNGMLFSGAEDMGVVMKKLGMDPKTTVFVNDELFRALNQENPDVIKEQLFAQREYLALTQIYEISGQPGVLDTLMYEKDMTSGPAHQLLKLFVETKTSQIFKPTDKEREFLLNQFQNLIKNPERVNQLAPDVITAYNLYNEISSGIERGVTPTQEQSQALIEALNNFEKTTNKRVLLSLGIGINQSVANATPLSPSVIDPADVFDTALNVSTTGPEIIPALDQVTNFLEYPEKYDFMNPAEKATATLVVNDAVLLLSIVESPEAKNLKEQELINYITQKLQEKNISINPSMQNYISYFSYNKRQCGAMNLMLTNILAQRDPKHFHDMEAIGGDSAKSFIGDLLEDNRHSPYLIDKTVLVPGGIEGDYLYKRLVTDFSIISPGDSLVIAFPWLDNNSSQDNSHIAEVILKGVENGKPYILIFESNANSDGVTGFRKVFDLQELIPDHVLEVRSKLYPNPEEAARYPAIFGIVRYESGQ